jgi:hypothetical protein
MCLNYAEKKKKFPKIGIKSTTCSDVHVIERHVNIHIYIYTYIMKYSALSRDEISGQSTLQMNIDSPKHMIVLLLGFQKAS